MTTQIAREETCCCYCMGYSFRLAARVLLSHRQDSTYHSLCYASRGALTGMRNNSMVTPWRINLTTHHTISEYSYHRATSHYLDFVSSEMFIMFVMSCNHYRGVKCSSMVRHPLMLQWVVGSIPHGGPIPASAPNWINKGCGMCYPVYGMVYMKETLLLINKSSPCSGGSRFPLSLSKWSIHPTPR